MSERTEWLALWRNRQGVYSGQVFKKKDIPPHSRLIVHYNKFYNSANPHSPRFVFCFASGEVSEAITMERQPTKRWAKYDEEEDTFYDNDGNRLYTEEEVEENYYTYEDVQRAIDGATRDALNGYTDNIVSDYL